MAKMSNVSKFPNTKAKPVIKARTPDKALKNALARAKKSLQPVKAFAVKTPPPKAKKEGSKRRVSDIKIAKLQKMYHNGKYSAQDLCAEFGISTATLFNYLKVSV